MSKKRIIALTQPMHYVLSSLKENRHGYVGPSTLYSFLSRFE